MEYYVVAAKEVANGLESLNAWLNRMAHNGWKVVAVDDGVIYLGREKD